MEGKGFEVGDLLTHLDGMKIDAYEPAHQQRFPTMIRRYKPGTEAIFTVLRNGKTEKIKYVLDGEPRPEREMDRYRNDFLEFVARDLTVMDRIDRRLPQDQVGAMVDTVKPGSWAQLGGLDAGDIIRAVNGSPVATVADLTKAMADVMAKKPASIVVFVQRDANTRYVEIRPDWSRQ